jgi:hypothetical protein
MAAENIAVVIARDDVQLRFVVALPDAPAAHATRVIA